MSCENDFTRHRAGTPTEKMEEEFVAVFTAGFPNEVRRLSVGVAEEDAWAKCQRDSPFATARTLTALLARFVKTSRPFTSRSLKICIARSAAFLSANSTQHQPLCPVTGCRGKPIEGAIAIRSRQKVLNSLFNLCF